MDIVDLLGVAVNKQASDIFLVAGMPLSYKVGGRIEYYKDEKLFPDQIDEMITQLYSIAGKRSMKKIQETGDDDFSFALPNLSRFRANVFRQRGTLAAIIRIITFELPDYEKLHLPRTIIDVAKMTKGMVLVTGPAGSGKSTTLACIINEINRTRNAHVSSPWRTLSSISTATIRAWFPERDRNGHRELRVGAQSGLETGSGRDSSGGDEGS